MEYETDAVDTNSSDICFSIFLFFSIAPAQAQIIHAGQACVVKEDNISERVYTIREGDILVLQCLVTGHPRPQVSFLFLSSGMLLGQVFSDIDHCISIGILLPTSSFQILFCLTLSYPGKLSITKERYYSKTLKKKEKKR